MKNCSIAVSLTLLSSLVVMADVPQEKKPPENLMDLYLPKETTWQMTPQEKKAIAIAEKWRADSAKGGVKPVAGPGGTLDERRRLRRLQVAAQHEEACLDAMPFEHSEHVRGHRLGGAVVEGKGDVADH